MRYVIAFALALSALLGLAAPASACTTLTTMAVPAEEVAYVYDGALSVAEDCIAYVSTDEAGVVVWQDYAQQDGTLVPLAQCEGEDVPRTFTVGTPDEDGVWEYVIGAQI